MRLRLAPKLLSLLNSVEYVNHGFVDFVVGIVGITKRSAVGICTMLMGHAVTCRDMPL